MLEKPSHSGKHRSNQESTMERDAFLHRQHFTSRKCKIIPIELKDSRKEVDPVSNCVCL